MKRRLATLVHSAFMAIAASCACEADEQAEFFEARIRPVLVEHCYECHSPSAKKLGGGLRLDRRDGWRRGGESGPAIEPGKPAASLLLQAVRYTNESLQMPPKGKLPAHAIADLEAWIARGATDPREGNPEPSRVAATWADTLRERAKWWSLQPVQDSPVPAPRDVDWSAHPVDRFVLAKLEETGLAPSAPAAMHTIRRRLSLVLTGLPPDQNAPEDIRQLVDRLLDSPHFGERWARHWMDVVRFTETHGNEWNYEVHHAWRYRDYLIRALNADVPFDRMVREHIVGDLLPPRWNDRDQLNESVIGTAFYRFGEVNHDDCISLRQLGFDIADNQIDTLTKAFQATTVACARCHDHKFDAVSTRDYYGLLGILRSSRMVSHCIDAPAMNAPLLQRLAELKVALKQELTKVWSNDANQVARYLLAAQAKRSSQPDAVELARDLDAARLEKWVAALGADKQPLEDLLEPWRQLAAAPAGADFGAEWMKLAERYQSEHRSRAEFNARFGEFPLANWLVDGPGIRNGPSRAGEFVLHSSGDAVVSAVFPEGYFTHALSDKLTGTLRSPVLPVGKKHISFQVLGQRSSAVRLVSNNCQLNYKNYKALTSNDWRWETFSPPEDRDALQTYAELMTMFDNPKFPDQLSALGGDTGNYRMPWDKAAENPRSWFGIARAVWHESPEPPKPELSHLLPLFVGVPPSRADVATRFAQMIHDALRRWSDGLATDRDARWLDGLLRRELLTNLVHSTPKLAELAAEYRRVEAQLASPRIVPGVGESGGAFEQPILVRGDAMRPSERAPRGYVEVLALRSEPLSASASGRRELAEQIADPRNPLTARVMVNRVWHHLFGTGLVRSVDDFGHAGELPSHPELLDYLANQFMNDGWSVKRLIRSLVLTRTFQLASQPSALALERDPDNRLLQHYPARRMEAEVIRDAMLAASGRLDRSLFGPSVQPFRDKEYADRRLFPGPLDGHGRRSIYIKNNLMEGPKFLAAFNFPGGKIAQGRRDVTNVPAQALALLNDPFVLQQADAWASRLVARTGDSLATRVEDLFQIGLQRAPTVDEFERFEVAVRQLAELQQITANEMLTNQSIWRDVAHAVFNLQEFVYIP